MLQASPWLDLAAPGRAGGTGRTFAAPSAELGAAVKNSTATVPSGLR
jgi:hypothetical protein